MSSIKFHLVDVDSRLCDEWMDAFDGIENVEVRCGDFFQVHADAMVSPANSFGFMDGGLDDAISGTLRGGIQRPVQDMILNKHHGEIPVGVAGIVPTEDDRWPLLIVAPTMRVPENVSNTVNAYLAFRAILVAVNRHNAATPSKPIESVLVPGLATGVGRLSARRCAVQMRVAYNTVSQPPHLSSFQSIHTTHLKMLSA